jgi:hypothetical protein
MMKLAEHIPDVTHYRVMSVPNYVRVTAKTLSTCEEAFCSPV